MQALNNLLEDSNININDEIEIFVKQVNKLINIEHEGISNNSQYIELLKKKANIDKQFLKANFSFKKSQYLKSNAFKIISIN